MNSGDLRLGCAPRRHENIPAKSSSSVISYDAAIAPDYS